MKVALSLCALFIITLVSCKKNNNGCGFKDSSLTASQNEQTALADSLNKYNIPATIHPSGVYYQVLSSGSGNKNIDLCSKVTVTYWGGFFNGSGFDSSETPIPLILGQTIVGWQKAIPMLKGEGQINIYIPPSLGYGNKNITNNMGATIIPANSYLVFKVKVISVD